ncbi:MAG TPA: SCO family protein [Candidatus Angelobacter sp.]
MHVEPGKMLVTAVSGAASDCARPLRGPHAECIPNIIVRTHLNQRAWFYDDLIWRKTFLIHCIDSKTPESFAALKTMARVQALLDKRMGHDVFIYSITADPASDTPSNLRSLAEQYGAHEGWLFLTGEEKALEQLRRRIFIYNGGHDCSMMLVRYGNEAVGVWGGIPASNSPEEIAERIAWITPREIPAGPPQRGGPPLLAGQEDK